VSNVPCEICGQPVQDDRVEAIDIYNRRYNLCPWCETCLGQFVDCRVNHSAINIHWGSGRVSWDDWRWLRDFVRANGIHEVLEFGTGLSTELFVNEGLEVTTCDILPYHSALFAQHPFIGQVATVLCYEEGHPPEFDRQWDFVFVDGPQERRAETLAAMRYSRRWIYCHDIPLIPTDLLPSEEWEALSDKLFRRRDEGLEVTVDLQRLLSRN
jgi:hypothetical protein